jgi:hypothetical protein
MKSDVELMRELQKREGMEAIPFQDYYDAMIETQVFAWYRFRAGCDSLIDAWFQAIKDALSTLRF